MCKSWCELILGVIILVVAAWPNLLGAQISMWVTIIAAAVLIIHSFTCKKCFAGKGMRR